MTQGSASPAFVNYQEAAKITGKTIRTIRRKIQKGDIAESQIRKQNGSVLIGVSELQRVFGDLQNMSDDVSEDTTGHDRTNQGVMSPDITGIQDIFREYLDFTKQQLEWEQKRNERLEIALEEMREERRILQDRLSRLLPEGDTGADKADTEQGTGQGTETDKEEKTKRKRRWWLLWIV
jgi:hypothetical protein